MKFKLLSVGKAHEPYVKEGISMFTKRISFYYNVEWHLIPSPKHAASLSVSNLKKVEAENILPVLNNEDVLVVLDENGKQLSSEQLAGFIQQRANDSRNIIFIIGGAYGLDDMILKKADLKWSLSTLVFPHQLVRLILTEQIYRACTIIRNEKYHHS
jgi:23S rRNA (pseudouridine1915-N3)-methyltransferase